MKNNKMFFVFVFSLFFLCFNTAQADNSLVSDESLIYYNKKFNFSFNLDNEWFKYPKEYKKMLAPGQREHLMEGFIKNDGLSHIHINAYDETDERFEVYKDVFNYINYTEEEDRNLSRYLNKIKVIYGLKVSEFSVDEQDKTITFHLKGTINNTLRIKKNIHWLYINDSLIEFEIQEPDSFKSNVSFYKKDNPLLESLNFEPTTNETTIEAMDYEGIVKLKKTNQSFSKVSLDKLLNLMIDKTLWTILIVITFLTFALFISLPSLRR